MSSTFSLPRLFVPVLGLGDQPLRNSNRLGDLFLCASAALARDGQRFGVDRGHDAPFALAASSPSAAIFRVIFAGLAVSSMPGNVCGAITAEPP